MGTTTRPFLRVDGGLTRWREPVTAEAKSLGRASLPVQAVDVLNMQPQDGLICRRNGAAPYYADDDPLGIVVWFSGWTPWRDGNNSTGANNRVPDLPDLTVLIEGGTVTRRHQTGTAVPPRRRVPIGGGSTPAFKILTPAANATCQPLALPFSWQPVKGALGYCWAINTRRDRSVADLTSGSTIATVTSVTLPGDVLAHNTRYYLFVWAQMRPVTNFAQTSAALVAANNSPRVFWTKLAQATGLTSGTVSLTPTLTWNAVTGAGGYVVTIKEGATTKVTSGVLTSPTYTVPPAILEDGHTYSWFVTARDVATGVPGCEVASEEASVTVSQPTIDLSVLGSGTSAGCSPPAEGTLVGTYVHPSTYAIPMKLRSKTEIYVDDYLKANGTVLFAPAYNTFCNDNRYNTGTVASNTEAGYVLPANTVLTLQLYDTVGFLWSATGTLELVPV